MSGRSPACSAGHWPLPRRGGAERARRSAPGPVRSSAAAHVDTTRHSHADALPQVTAVCPPARRPEIATTSSCDRRHVRAWRAQRAGRGTGGALTLPRDHACTRPPGPLLGAGTHADARTEVGCAPSAVGGRRTLRGLAQSVRRCTSMTCALRSDHGRSPPVSESWRWAGVPRQPARRRRVPRETWRRSGPLPSRSPSRTARRRRPWRGDSGGADVWVVGAERVAARRSVGSGHRRATRVRARPVPRETTARRRAPGCSLLRRMCARRPVLLGPDSSSCAWASVAVSLR